MASSTTSSLVELTIAPTLPIKLGSNNHHTWHTQISHLRQAHDLYGYVTGETACPPSIIGLEGSAAKVNPDYTQWKRQDHYMFLALLGSCGPDAQIVMTSAVFFVAAWTSLNKQYANRSRTRVMSLKERLSTITKGTSNVTDYLRSIRVIADELALIDHPVDDLDLVITALNGLGPSFHEFTASIRTRDTHLLFDELFDKLVDFEIFMQRDERQQQSFPVTANYTTRFQNSNRGKLTQPPYHTSSSSNSSHSSGDSNHSSDTI